MDNNRDVESTLIEYLYKIILNNKEKINKLLSNVAKNAFDMVSKETLLELSEVSNHLLEIHKLVSALELDITNSVSQKKLLTFNELTKKVAKMQEETNILNQKTNEFLHILDKLNRILQKENKEGFS